MGYRRGYYRKDGTYVKGHFYSKGRKKIYKSNNKKGCAGIALILITISFITFLIH